MSALRTLVGTTALVLAAAQTAVAGGPPDALSYKCVDPAQRDLIRQSRAQCDDLATSDKNMYNVGIFRPANPNDFDGNPPVCVLDLQLYVCLGAPGVGLPPGQVDDSCDPEAQACELL